MEPIQLIESSGIFEDIKMANFLYECYLNMFMNPILLDNQIMIENYNKKIISFVYILRNHDINYIKDVMNIINFKYPNEVFCDLIIMSWSLPKPFDIYSYDIYENNYKNNIQKYNFKLLELKNEKFMVNFINEIINKRCNVTIHCIDYIWEDLIQGKIMEFGFINKHFGKSYFKINVLEDHENVKLSINMPSILSLGLGNIGKKTNLQKIINDLVNDTKLNTEIKNSQQNNNFIEQCKIIRELDKK